MTLWAFSYIWVKEALNVVTPITLILLRLTIAGTLLYIFSKSIRKFQKVNKKDLKYFIALAFFEPFLYFIGETFGLKYVSPTIAAIFIATIPLFVPIFLLIFYKEKLLLYNIIGIIISIIGVLLIILKDDLTLIAPLKGFLFMGLAVISAVICTIIVVKVAHKYSALTIITRQNIYGAMGIFILFLIFDLKSFDISVLTFKNILPIFELAILPSSVSYLFFIIAIKRLGANQASVFSNLIPVLTAVFSYFIVIDGVENENLTTKTILGIFIVITGLSISQLKPKQKF